MSKNINFATYFDEDLSEIKKIIRTNLKSRDRNVSTLMSNLAAVEGKMIRAILVLVGGSFGKIEKDRLFHISAGIELLHLATLVHDDIIDDSDLRRGKKTINSTCGMKPALYIGDYLFAQSFTLLSRHSSPKSIIDISETIKFICQSEINQFLSTYSLSSTIKDYLKRVNGKCASLFSLSLCIGAYEGNADEKIIQKLRKIGYCIGMAFQLTDDILDITSPKILLGKPSGNDIKEGIYTFPVLYEICNKNEALINSLKDSNFSKTLEILKHSYGLKKSIEISERYTYKALELIDELPNNQEKLILETIGNTLLKRTF